MMNLPLKPHDTIFEINIHICRFCSPKKNPNMHNFVHTMSAVRVKSKEGKWFEKKKVKFFFVRPKKKKLNANFSDNLTHFYFIICRHVYN